MRDWGFATVRIGNPVSCTEYIDSEIKVLPGNAALSGSIKFPKNSEQRANRRTRRVAVFPRGKGGAQQYFRTEDVEFK